MACADPNADRRVICINCCPSGSLPGWGPEAGQPCCNRWGCPYDGFIGAERKRLGTRFCCPECIKLAAEQDADGEEQQRDTPHSRKQKQLVLMQEQLQHREQEIKQQRRQEQRQQKRRAHQ